MNARLRSLLGVVSVGALAVLGLACGSAPTDGDDAVSSSSEEALKARVVTDGHFTGADGKPVRYRTYEHAADEKAIVVFLNGRGEFVEKYDVLFSKTHEFPVGKADNDETLVNMPVSFVALDHEGQGDSKDGRIAGHVDNFEYFVKDVETLFATLPKLAQHKVPIIMVGHSMGGLIAARFAQDNQGKIDGLVLSSPMLKHLVPGGLTEDEFIGVAGFYAGYQGMPTLCTQPPGVSLTMLAGIPLLLQSPLAGCFDPKAADSPACQVPVCAVTNDPKDCGTLIDFHALEKLQYFNTVHPGCIPDDVSAPDWKAPCPDNGLTTDISYCEYYYSSPRRAPASTFGWLLSSMISQGMYAGGQSVNVPVLLMTNGADQVVDSSAHVCAGPIAGDCEVATFSGFGHELLSSAGREAPIAKIKSFINARIK